MVVVELSPWFHHEVACGGQHVETPVSTYVAYHGSPIDLSPGQIPSIRWPTALSSPQQKETSPRLHVIICEMATSHKGKALTYSPKSCLLPAHIQPTRNWNLRTSMLLQEV